MMKFKSVLTLSKWFLFPVVLAGCTGLTQVGADGQALSAPVWPAPQTVTLDNQRGISGDMHRIGLIHNGATRDDIYQLIGRPHFHEGFRIREWDYLFYFSRQDGSRLTCQYKILFDKNKIARSFYWHTVAPAGAQCPPDEYYRFSGKALFRFNGDSLADLRTGGQQALDALAEKIRQAKDIQAVIITGYTDYLGTAAYNLALSRRRAQTVRQYLLDRGVNAQLLHVAGQGATQPHLDCAESQQNRADLVNCLQPDRRVEITVKRYSQY